MSKLSHRVVLALAGVLTAMVVVCGVLVHMSFVDFADTFRDDPRGPAASIDGRYCSVAGDLLIITGHRFIAPHLTPRIAQLIGTAGPAAEGQGAVDWSRGDGYSAADFTFEEPRSGQPVGDALEAIMTETGAGLQLDFGFSSEPLTPCE